MRTTFVFSYALLWALIVLEAAVLREVLRGTIWLKRFYIRIRANRPTGVTGLPNGVPAPDFSAPLLGTGRALNKDDLKGDPTILLFVSPTESFLPGYQQLRIAIHALWHQVAGRLYLICSGGEEACQRFAFDHQVPGFTEHQVPIVFDNQGSIARSFQIDSTPMAVELDEDVLVNRYGGPVVESIAEGGEQEEAERAKEAEQSSPDIIGLQPRDCGPS